MHTITSATSVEKLASYQRCIRHIRASWPLFLEKRQLRLKQQDRYAGVASEKVAENSIEDLFTQVLDWELSDLNNQVEHADIVLTKEGVKYLLLEIKRPGALAWNQHAVEKALAQAIHYASEQRVTCVAISDGEMLYAANLHYGGLEDRLFVSLVESTPPLDLWWLSVHGIYRPCTTTRGASSPLLPQTLDARGKEKEHEEGEEMLHPKYHLPASCFAYVADPARPGTWKLPYRLLDGSIDERRLPKAIQAILSNYRGVKVSGIPEEAIPAVLTRLASGVESIGRMPSQRADTAMIYRQLAEVLEQINRASGHIASLPV